MSDTRRSAPDRDADRGDLDGGGARDLGGLLLELGPRITHIQRHALGRMDPPLTYRQFRILHRVWDGATSLTALRSPATVSLSTLSEIVDSLVRRGLLDRSPNPADRRSVELSLTAEGHDLLQRAQVRLERLSAELTQGLPESAERAATPVLAQLDQRVRGMLERDHTRGRAAGD